MSLKDLNQSILHDPKGIASFNSRGDLYKENYKFKEALQDYSEILATNPKISKSYLNRCIKIEKSIGVAMKNSNDLTKQYQTIQKQFNQIQIIQRHIVIEEMLIKRSINIKKLLMIILQQQIQIQIIHNHIIIEVIIVFIQGILHKVLYELDEVLEDYSKAIKLNLNYANAYHNRGKKKLYNNGLFIKLKENLIKPIKILIKLQNNRPRTLYILIIVSQNQVATKQVDQAQQLLVQTQQVLCNNAEKILRTIFQISQENLNYIKDSIDLLNKCQWGLIEIEKNKAKLGRFKAISNQQLKRLMKLQ